MSFLVTHYHLIEPKPNLVARANALLDADFARVFLKRIVVAKSYADTKSDQLEQAHMATLKQGFLARCKHDWSWDSPTQFMELLETSELTTELFDRWWQCSQITCEWFDDWQPFIDQGL
jgi:hypothetical protein